VIARLKRAIRPKRIGHAGTLDPAASGVLLVCLGNATRIVEYLMDQPKAYRAVAVFGAETDTEDQTGNVLSETDCSGVTEDTVGAVLPRFTGTIMQIPPMVSAVHHQGRRLYELARAGVVVEREPRPVQVHALTLVSFRPGEKAEATLDIECSRGTYVRTLCADIGRALGCGGYMSSLVRTAIGEFRLEDAVPVERAEELAKAGRLAVILHPMDEALRDLPSLVVSGSNVKRVMNGVLLPLGQLAPGDSEGAALLGAFVRIHGPEDQLLAVGRIRRLPNGQVVLKPEKVFPRGD
jgi:tRNA pseudouridine55 synthase